MALLDRPRSKTSNQLNSDAQVVYNHVYNFAPGQGDTSIVSHPRQEVVADPPALPEPPERYWTFTRVCLRFVTLICTLTVGVVFGSFLLVIFLGIMRLR